MSGGNRTARKTPNQALQEERLRHGWTQQDVADKIGTTVVNVSRWERGATSPSPYFRQQLCRLFEKDAAVLGLLPAVPASNSSDAYPSQEEPTSPVVEKELTASSDQMAQEEVAVPASEQGLTAPPDYPVHKEVVSSILETGPEKSSKSVFVLFTQLRLPSWLSAAVMGVLLVCLIFAATSGFLISSLFKAQPAGTARPLSQGEPVRPTPPLPKMMYSFEDGSTDDWKHKGHILIFQNSDAIGGYEGSHALRIVFSSRNSTDLPYISVNPSSSQPKSGQILSAAVFLPGGTAATVSAKLYVQDSAYKWHSPGFTTLASGKWQVLQYPLPSFPGPALQVGIQFLSVPFNTQITVYVDAVAW